MVLSPRLNAAEIEQITGWLSAGEGEMFFGQPGYDQRHGLEAAAYVAKVQPHRRDLIRAALFHDLGKRHANLGPVGRSLASAYAKLGGRPRGAWRSYLEHGQVAAGELAGIGAEPIVVDFARHHHGPRPASIAEDDWRLLQASDKVRRARFEEA